jgi:Sulfatase
MAARATVSAYEGVHGRRGEEWTVPGKQPNVLIIVGDDVGWFDVGCYHQGIMGGRTPNIDRIADEGVRLTDFYALGELHGGSCGADHRADSDADRSDDGRDARCAEGDSA